MTSPFSTRVVPVREMLYECQVVPFLRESIGQVTAIDSAVFAPLGLPCWAAADFVAAHDAGWRVTTAFPWSGFLVCGMTESRRVVIERIAMHPDHRRQGRARTLLLEALHWAICTRAESISIRIPDQTTEIVRAMEPARSLARHLDFSFSEERNGYVEFVRRLR